MKVLIVPVRRYNGHELWVALEVLVREEIEFEIASFAPVITDETGNAGSQRPHMHIDEASSEGYDGLMIVSGNPKDTSDLWNHPKVKTLVEDFNARQSPLAAICASVPAIRYVGNGVKVSGYPLNKAIMLLEDAGCDVQNVSLTTDRNVVTAEHQMATEMWAENFADLLFNREPRHRLHNTEFSRQEKPRKPIPELETYKRRQAGVTGPEKCPECGYMTECRKGRIICPAGCGDFTEEGAPKK